MYECFTCTCCVHITFYMHCIVLTCMLLICDTEINQSINEDTLYSHMYRNLNQCRFEGIGFTNTRTSKHLTTKYPSED